MAEGDRSIAEEGDVVDDGDVVVALGGVVGAVEKAVVD